MSTDTKASSETHGACCSQDNHAAPEPVSAAASSCCGGESAQPAPASKASCCGGDHKHDHGHAHHDHAHHHHAHGHDHHTYDAIAAEDGRVIDPVCGMRVDPTTRKHVFDHGHTTYHFCSAGCRTKFAADPQR